MKLSIVYIGLLLFVLSANYKDVKRVEEDKSSSIFFYLNGRTLATHLLTDSSDHFGNLDFKRGSRVRHVPVSFLSSIGLKEHDKIQFVSFSDGKQKEYVLGKKVYILLFKTESSLAMYKWGTFNLILSDDVNEHKKLSSLPEILPKDGDGLAIRGDINLIDGSYSLLSFTQLKAKDPLRKLFERPSRDIRASYFKGSSLLVDFDKEGRWNTTILSTPKGSYFLEPVTLSSKNDLVVAHMGSFIKEGSMLMSVITPDLDCSRVNILKDGVVTYKDIHCIRRNIVETL
jgi:hypothetical protein